jgi:prephenate dehydrogenase
MMNSITSQKQGAYYLTLAGTGFRDFTRIAASDPKMWLDIFLANRVEILGQMTHFKQTLQDMEDMIESSDSKALESALNLASQTRGEWQLSTVKQHK